MGIQPDSGSPRLIQRSYKFRCYPTPAQQRDLACHFDANPQDGSDTGVMVELDTFGGMYTIRYTHRERLQAFNDRIAEVEQKELKENDKALDEIM